MALLRAEIPQKDDASWNVMESRRPARIFWTAREPTSGGAGAPGVRGDNYATANGNGVEGYALSSAGSGVYGQNDGGGNGVEGYAVSSAGIGVYGIHQATSGTGPGVQGDTSSTSGNAVGVLGRVTSASAGPASVAVRGINANTGMSGIGVWGSHANAQAIVSKEIDHNAFTIRTNKPSVKVSWQVTGIRHDRYANANRIQVVVPKTGSDAGKYLHPELYGKAKSAGIGYRKPPRAQMQK